MGSSPVTPQDVLSSLMNDGTFDALRSKIINQLKTNEELRKNTISMVEQSKVLNTPGAENKTRRELFDALRRELDISVCRTPVLDKASKSVWELILSKEGLGKEIDDTVEGVYRRLSGQELPSSAFGDAHVSAHEENISGSSKKRSFTAMNTNGPSETLNHAHMSTPSIGRQTIGSLHGNESAHMGIPATGPAHTMNSQSGPWNSNHLKS